ncbi:hypothetical protein [Deinococcus sp.]|uniref:hypothetical protein n=1 Tax=Deinococcus sp. TaxID=47478 RepID=UPI0028698D79|nr:hypothetical protein [Deinococcus sp.]
MNSRSLQDACQDLGLNANWLNIGWEDEILSAHSLLLSASDKNAEHYRWRLFKTALGEQQHFTSDNLERYFSIALSENDLPLRSSMLHELIVLADTPREYLLKAAPLGNRSVKQKADAILAQMKQEKY